jgi:hypothetical protein
MACMIFFPRKLRTPSQQHRNSLYGALLSQNSSFTWKPYTRGPKKEEAGTITWKPQFASVGHAARSSYFKCFHSDICKVIVPTSSFLGPLTKRILVHPGLLYRSAQLSVESTTSGFPSAPYLHVVVGSRWALGVVPLPYHDGDGRRQRQPSSAGQPTDVRTSG